MDREMFMRMINSAARPIDIFEHEPSKNNGFVSYRMNLETMTEGGALINSANPPLASRAVHDIAQTELSVPEEAKKLAVLSKRLWELAIVKYPPHQRMVAPRIISNKSGIIYFVGGLLFDDEKSISLIDREFGRDVYDEQVEGCIPEDSGLVRVFRAKKFLDRAVQFAARAEWASQEGYAHLCLGYIPI